MNLMENECPIKDVPAVANWSENFCFCVHDPETHIGMWFHVGRWAHDPQVWREIVTIALPGDRVLVAKSYGRNASATAASANFLSIQVVEPGKKFRLAYRGPVWERSRSELIDHGFRDGHSELLELDLTFEGCEPLWDTSGHAGESEELVGSMHIEQIGKGNGELSYKGKNYSISNAFMNRDHSRGVRDSAIYKRHSWLQGWSPSGRGFHAYTVEILGTDGYVMNGACIAQGGKLYPAKVVHVDFPNHLTDLYQPFSLQIESEFGKSDICIVKVFNSWPIAMAAPNDLGLARMLSPSGMFFEESVQFEWDGETGYGHSERAISLNSVL